MVRHPASWILAFLVAILLPASAPAEQVVVASNAIYVVDTEQGAVREVAKLGRFVKDLAVSASGSTSYAATSGGILEVDLVTGETVRVFGDGPARAVEVDDASGRLYGMFTMGPGASPELRVFGLYDGTLLRTSSLPASTKGLHWNAPDGSVIGLAHNERSLHLYDAATAADRGEIVIPRRLGKKPGASTLSPDVLVHETSGLIVVPEMGIEAGVWVVRDGNADWIALGHEAHFRGGVISPDERYVYLSALRHVAKIDLVEKREVAWVGLDVVHQRIALSSDGSALFLTVPVDGQSGALSVLSADTLEPVRRIAVEDASPFALAVVPE